MTGKSVKPFESSEGNAIACNDDHHVPSPANGMHGSSISVKQGGSYPEFIGDYRLGIQRETN
jgi:hypothetical protein